MRSLRCPQDGNVCFFPAQFSRPRQWGPPDPSTGQRDLAEAAGAQGRCCGASRFPEAASKRGAGRAGLVPESRPSVAVGVPQPGPRLRGVGRGQLQTANCDSAGGEEKHKSYFKHKS